MQYLAQAQRHCLMSEDTREVRAIIEPVLQCVVDFIDSFRYARGKYPRCWTVVVNLMSNRVCCLHDWIVQAVSRAQMTGQSYLANCRWTRLMCACALQE